VSKKTIGEWFDEGSHATDEEVGWLLNREYLQAAAFVGPRITRAGIRTVLELGCHSGLLARTLVLNHPSLTYSGVEASLALLRMARERFLDFPLERASFTDAGVPWDGATHDLVVSFSCLKHVPLEGLDEHLADLLARGENAAFDVQILDEDLDDGRDYPHCYVTEDRLLAAVGRGGHAVVAREVWYEGNLSGHGLMRNVAFWTTSSGGAIAPPEIRGGGS
jgi:predicted TPR repeat methyltransferase